MLQHYLKKEKKSGCFSLDQIGGQAADEIMNAVALKRKKKKKKTGMVNVLVMNQICKHVAVLKKDGLENIAALH